jgi:site-specific DNA-methyltransferase (adenine-specific)
MENITLYHDDCAKIIRELRDDSVDCVMTDPPYFIDKLDDSWDADKVAGDASNSHIKHLPKGMKFSKDQSKKLYEYYKEISELLFAKVKPGGVFLSFSSPRLYHAMAMAMDDAGFEVRDMVNWVYQQSMPKGMSVMNQIERLEVTDEEKAQLKLRYEGWKTPQVRSCFEPVCVAMKPFPGTYLQNEMKHGTGLVDFKATTGDSKVPANIITTEEMGIDFYDKNFIVKKPAKKEKGDYNNHVSVKPVELMEQLLRVFTKQDALVVDPFLGSGTTGVACKKTGRRFVGMEKNKAYFDIATRRIAEAEK